MIEKSILNQNRSSVPTVVSWLVPLIACLPSTIILYFAKKVAQNDHQSSMSNFPGPTKCMEIFGDCLVKDMMWETCAVARTKRSFSETLFFVIACEFKSCYGT
jgi:hypothetical protein